MSDSDSSAATAKTGNATGTSTQATGTSAPPFSSSFSSAFLSTIIISVGRFSVSKSFNRFHF